jgi:hypothetical protein
VAIFVGEDQAIGGMFDRELPDVLANVVTTTCGKGIVRCDAPVFGGARNGSLWGRRTSC